MRALKTFLILLVGLSAPAACTADSDESAGAGDLESASASATDSVGAGMASAPSSMAGMDHGDGADTPHEMAGATDHTRPGASANGGMAMDHGAISAAGGGSSSAAGGMAGMDHTTMGAADPRPAGDGVAMDHSGGGMASAGGGMAGMDHAAMGSTATRAVTARPDASPSAEERHDVAAHQPTGAAAAANPSGSAHAAHPGTTPTAASAAGAATGAGHVTHAAAAAEPTDQGIEKLKLLVAELVEDPAVQERIAADTVLSRLWQTEAVRRALRPEAH